MTDAVLRWWHPPGPPVTQTLGSSPWTYTNVSTAMQIVAWVGGVVTLVEVNVGGSGFAVVLIALGVYTLMPGDQIRITFLITPPVVTVVQL